MSDLNKIALSIPCAYCKAEPTYWCVTSTDRVATFLHGARTHAIYRAFGAGYSEATADYKERSTS
jgi:hypothetical protein